MDWDVFKLIVLTISNVQHMHAHALVFGSGNEVETNKEQTVKTITDTKQTPNLSTANARHMWKHLQQIISYQRPPWK